MKKRKLKKALLIVGCLVPGIGLVCGDELAKPKWRKR